MSVLANRFAKLSRLSMIGCLGLAFAACGGKSKSSATTDGVTSSGEDDDSGDPCGGDPCADGMCPPEVLDSIQQSLLRRRTAAARCLTDAVNAGKAERNSSGAVALSFVIGKNGKARDIKVVKSSIQNELVEQCVVSKVEEIDFGDVPIDLDWSHTYAFESN
jgi:hypothetical protein